MVNIRIFLFTSNYVLILTGRGTKSSETFSTNESKDEELDLPLFDFETISHATNNFSLSNKLGEGGFGPVYKVTM